MTTSLAPYQRRLTAFQTQLAVGEAALISKPNDIFYFTGFPQLAPAEREAFLLISPSQTVLFHHSFSPILPKQDWLATLPKTDLAIIAARLPENTTSLLIDELTLSVAEYQQLKKHLDIPLKPLSPQRVWDLRTRKDADELALMKTAGRIAVSVFDKISAELKPGLSERTVANRITALMLEEEAETTAFPVIVAFGENGALPHHQPTHKKLAKEMPVLIDFGASYRGYLSDMTRSFWFGSKPSQLFLAVEKVVQTAYQKTLDRLKKRGKKLTAKELDAVARQYITHEGYGDQFIHTTGHGLGIEIHEPPSLSWQNSALIVPGTTLTVEPGIYLPSEFGYRHENTVAIMEKGIRILTQL